MTVSKPGNPIILIVGEPSLKHISLQIAGLLLGQKLTFVLPPGYDLRFLNIEHNGKVIAETGICTSRTNEPTFGAIRVDDADAWVTKTTMEAAGRSAVEQVTTQGPVEPVKPLRKVRQRRQQ